MPQDSQTLPSEIGPDIDVIGEIPRPPNLMNGQSNVVISPDFISDLPSTSHATKLLIFSVNFNDSTVEIPIPEIATVSKSTQTFFPSLIESLKMKSQNC